MKEEYRVVFWKGKKIKVTAPTNYSDAYDTAKEFKGVLVKEVVDFTKGE